MSDEGAIYFDRFYQNDACKIFLHRIDWLFSGGIVSIISESSMGKKR